MYQNNLALTGEITQLSRDFDVGETPVIAKGIGGKKMNWKECYAT